MHKHQKLLAHPNLCKFQIRLKLHEFISKQIIPCTDFFNTIILDFKRNK